MRYLVLSLFALGCVGELDVAQPPPQPSATTHPLKVTVVRAGTPDVVAGATVTAGGMHVAVTDGQGVASFAGLPFAELDLTVSAAHHLDATMRLGAQTTDALLQLVPVTPVELAVTVSAGGQVRFPDGTSCLVGTCTRGFDPGTKVTLTAVADGGFHFAQWLPASCADELVLSAATACEVRFEPDRPALTAMTVRNSPADIATFFTETAKITRLDLSPTGVHVDFTKRDGPGSWPDVPFGAPGDSLEYTLWIVINVNGTWYTSGCIQYWRGLDKNGGPPDEYAMNWYYDSIRWGPMVGHQPQPSETVGFFVSAGDARNVTDHSGSIAFERSDIVWVPFPTAAGAVYTF